MIEVARTPHTDPILPHARARMEEEDAVAGHAPGESRGDELRERRDIVSGEVLPESRLIRFVADPDGQVVPDVAAKLPGRGLWVSATRAAIGTAVEKKLFARAAKSQVKADATLADRAEKALLARMIGDLGLARRSGALVMGFDNVLRALDGPQKGFKAPPNLLIEASDGSKDGKRKLYNAAHARELKPYVLECLTSAELGLALGRENVIHAAVQPGGLSERLTLDAERLNGLRNAPPAVNESSRNLGEPEESPARHSRAKESLARHSRAKESKS